MHKWKDIRPRIFCKKCKQEGKFWDHVEEKKHYRMCKLCGYKELVLDFADLESIGNLDLPYWHP